LLGFRVHRLGFHRCCGCHRLTRLSISQTSPHTGFIGRLACVFACMHRCHTTYALGIYGLGACWRVASVTVLVMFSRNFRGVSGAYWQAHQP
jgi:hypothetical protein